MYCRTLSTSAELFIHIKKYAKFMPGTAYNIYSVCHRTFCNLLFLHGLPAYQRAEPSRVGKERLTNGRHVLLGPGAFDVSNLKVLR